MNHCKINGKLLPVRARETIQRACNVIVAHFELKPLFYATRVPFREDCVFSGLYFLSLFFFSFPVRLQRHHPLLRCLTSATCGLVCNQPARFYGYAQSPLVFSHLAPHLCNTCKHVLCEALQFCNTATPSLTSIQKLLSTSLLSTETASNIQFWPHQVNLCSR